MCCSILTRKFLYYKMLINKFFASYKSEGDIDDAITHVLYTIYTRLDLPGTTLGLMFFDFSNAFYTI